MDIVTGLTVAKNVVLLVVFFLGCCSITLLQVVMKPILGMNNPRYQDFIGLTKRYFITLLTFIMSWISPVEITLTYDKDQLPPHNSFKQTSNGELSTILSPNSVLMGNHQIYTDWFYLWFITYTARLSEGVYIILKDALSKIPVLGYGMNNFNFMFLSRKWDQDKVRLTNQLLEIDADARGSGPSSGVKHIASTNISDDLEGIKQWPKQSMSGNIFPYEIILYPEGTVPSNRTTKKSREFCEKLGVKPLKHLLLPRVRGLFLVLRKLRNTAEVVYDITCGYGGLTPDVYGEDIFTLKNIFLFGKGPKSIHYHLRSIRLEDIPLGEETVDIDDVKEEDLKVFEKWLYELWYEKDELMKNFYKYGKFVSPHSENLNKVEKVENSSVTGNLQLRNVFEIVSVYVPITVAAVILWKCIKMIISRLF